MLAPRADLLRIDASEDVVTVRRVVREQAVALGFSLVDQTKLVTAASELARNTLQYGRGGTMRLEVALESGRRGIRLTFEDQGPGIADIEQAMRDGFTSGGGLGLGLSGSKRLCHDFSITSAPGVGTRVVIARWK
jgi:serine/threonine-protein kinase RsbT